MSNLFWKATGSTDTVIPDTKIALPHLIVTNTLFDGNEFIWKCHSLKCFNLHLEREALLRPVPSFQDSNAWLLQDPQYKLYKKDGIQSVKMSVKSLFFLFFFFITSSFLHYQFLVFLILWFFSPSLCFVNSSQFFKNYAQSSAACLWLDVLHPCVFCLAFSHLPVNLNPLRSSLFPVALPPVFSSHEPDGFVIYGGTLC